MQLKKNACKCVQMYCYAQKCMRMQYVRNYTDLRKKLHHTLGAGIAPAIHLGRGIIISELSRSTVAATIETNEDEEPYVFEIVKGELWRAVKLLEELDGGPAVPSAAVSRDSKGHRSKMADMFLTDEMPSMFLRWEGRRRRRALLESTFVQREEDCGENLGYARLASRHHCRASFGFALVVWRTRACRAMASEGGSDPSEDVRQMLHGIGVPARTAAALTSSLGAWLTNPARHTSIMLASCRLLRTSSSATSATLAPVSTRVSRRRARS